MALTSEIKENVVGELPFDWKLMKLLHVAPLQRGFDLPTSLLRKGPFPVVYSNGIQNDHNRAMASGPGVVTGRSGTIGKVTYIEAEFWPHNTTLWVTNFKGNIPKFIYYLYCYINLGRFQSGSGVPTLNRNDVHAYQVLIPSRPEQRAIVEVLSDVDALINKLDQLIAKKRDVKQAAMQQLLTGKKRLPGFSEKWEEKKLGGLLDYEQPTRYLVESTEYSDKHDIAVLTANKSFVLGFTDESGGVFGNVPVIIFDDFTTASKYVDFPFKVKSSALKILKLKDLYSDLQFVAGWMQLIRFPLGGHKRYWISEFQHLEIRVPSYDEQSAIATVLTDMDAEIKTIEQRRNKTKMLKQGMMQELLTGKTRLI